MVLSCLVEPLVSPLIGRGKSGLGRSSLAGTRLASTALAVSVLIAISGTVSASELVAKASRSEVRAEQTVARNAHAKPAPVPYSELLRTVFAFRRLETLAAEPGESPIFEQKALAFDRLRHQRDIVRDPGPGLGLGQRLDRIYGGRDSTFLRFGSGIHLSGQPHSH